MKESEGGPFLDKHRFGPWAVVTGSSSCIGKAIARHLASSGINMVLIARRESQLESVGTGIAREFAHEALDAQATPRAWVGK